MDGIHSQLIAYGISTFHFSIKIELDGSPKQKGWVTKIKDGIGRIYGMYALIDGVDDAKPSMSNITSTDSANLFLTVKVGSTQIVDPIRLDQLVFKSIPSAINSERQYMPINFSPTISWDESELINPTGISNKIVTIGFYFINDKSWKFLLQKGVVLDLP